MSRTRRLLSGDVLVLAVYIVLAVVLTYPLITHLNTHVSGQGVDDPAQTWSLWWVKFSIFNQGVSPLSTDYLFYPLGINLVAYTPTFLNGILSLPLQFLFGVIPAQNFIAYFVLVAGGYGMFLLARQVLSRWTGLRERHRTVAAAIAGAFYAFGAWHIHYADATYMLLSNEWLPFYALYLLRLGTPPRRNGSCQLAPHPLPPPRRGGGEVGGTPQNPLKGRSPHNFWGHGPFTPQIKNLARPWRNGVILGLFLLLTAWTELTLALFLAVFTALYLFYLTLANRAALLNTLKGFVALAPLVAAGVSPLAYSLWQDTLRYGYYLAAGMGRVQVFSAEPLSFFVPSPQHPVLGVLASMLTSANTRYAFIGYAVLILAGLGFMSQIRSRETRFWGACALFFALVMLGPVLIVGGQSTGIPLPFAVLQAIPFVNANRYPVRFNVMLMLAQAPLVALGAAYVLQRRRGAFALGGLVVLLAFEQLVIPIPLSDLRVPPIYQTIGKEPGDFAVLELPLGWRGSVALQGKMEDKTEFYQTVHGKRILGGITSRTPRFKFQYFLEAPVINSLIALETGRELDETRAALDRSIAPEVLRFFNVRYVDINRTLADPALVKYALDVFPMEPVYQDDSRTVYRVTGSLAPLRQVDLQSEVSQLYFDERWGRVQADAGGTAYRWATSAASEIELPLARADQSITFRLRGWHAGQPIEVQLNSQAVAELTVTSEWADYVVRVPGALVGEGLNTFTFRTETTPLSAVPEEGYAIGETGVDAPVNIVATGAGYDAGRFGEIYVAGREIIPNQRGYHLVAIDPRTGVIDQVGSFDTFADANESTRLAQFVAALPEGEIVAGVAVDEVSRELKEQAIAALQQLGVEADLRYQFRSGHAFIGVKGAHPGQILEQVQGRLPANVAVGKNVAGDRIAFAMGRIGLGQ